MKKAVYKGFTLIELLVVISIIGVLVAFAMFGMQGAFEASRDTNRKSDLKQYQTALEAFANNNDGFYPRRNAGGGNGMANLCNDMGLSSCVEDTSDGEVDCDGNKCRYYYRTEDACGTAGKACAVRYILFAALENPRTDGYYWGVCWDGRSGEFTSASLPTDLDNLASCPIP